MKSASLLEVLSIVPWHFKRYDEGWYVLCSFGITVRLNAISL